MTVFRLPDEGQDSQVCDPNHPSFPNSLLVPTLFNNIFILEMSGRGYSETVSDPIVILDLNHTTLEIFPVTELVYATHYE
jgi:hypothetical protein